MAKYNVAVVMTTCETIEVEAHDEEEALKLAFEKADPFDADEWDYDIYSIYRDDDDEEEKDEE